MVKILSSDLSALGSSKTHYSQIVHILSDILCSELIHHFREVFNVTLGVPNATEKSFFSGGRRDQCNLPGVQFARKYMKLSSFICLTQHLSENVKIRHNFSSATYTIQKFWFYLCYVTPALRVQGISLIMHEKLTDIFFIYLFLFYLLFISHWSFLFYNNSNTL